MDITGSFRFLAMTAALLMWVGVVATANEPAGDQQEQSPAVESAPPAAPADDAADEGGEAPAEEGEEASTD